MLTDDQILETLKAQVPVLAKILSIDPVFESDNPDEQKLLDTFDKIKIVSKKPDGSLIIKDSMELETDKYCVIQIEHAELPSKEIVRIYSDLKKTIEMAVGKMAAAEIGFSGSAKCVATSKADLYGEITLNMHTEPEWIFFYRCKINLKWVRTVK